MTVRNTSEAYGTVAMALHWLMGVTKEIAIEARFVGAGDDPWGGYRSGFTGVTSIEMADFPIKIDFGTVEFDLVVEGIRQ